MKNIITKWLLALSLLPLLSSCLISRKTEYRSLASFTKGKDYTSRTIQVSSLLTKPVIMHQLKKEGEDEEIRKLARRLKGVKVNIIQSNNKNVLQVLKREALRPNMNEWLRVNHNNMFVLLKVKENKKGIKRVLVELNDMESKAIMVRLKCNLKYHDLNKLLQSVSTSDGKLDVTNIKL